MKDDILYLLHIRECIRRIEQYVKPGRKAFFESVLIQDAVLRNLQIMSESAQRLSLELKNEHSKTDWRGIQGFRNVLVHGYLGIDLARVWDIIEKDLPTLKRMLASQKLPRQTKSRKQVRRKEQKKKKP